MKGHPQGLAGLATHLHYHEPSNFVLVTFLRDGLLHDFCRCARSGGKFAACVITTAFKSQLFKYDRNEIQPRAVGAIQYQ